MAPAVRPPARQPVMHKVPPDLVRYYRMPSISSEMLRLETEGEDGALNVRITRPAVSDRHWTLQTMFNLVYGPLGCTVSQCIPSSDFLASGTVFCTHFGYKLSSFLALALLWALCSVLHRLRHVTVFPTLGFVGIRPSLIPLICCLHNLQLAPLWSALLRHSFLVSLVIGAVAGLYSQRGIPKARFEYTEHLRFTPSWDPDGKEDHGYVEPTYPSHVRIRLLRLFPRLPGHPVRATLREVSLGDPSLPPYEAISYTWGTDPTKNSTLILDGKALPCTAATYQALKGATRWWRFAWVWIDYVCINQDDKLEKSYQVGCMKYIYSRAYRVRVQMAGVEPAETAVAATMIHRTARLINTWDPAAADLAMFFRWEHATSTRWAALIGLFANPWFTRVWIIQEAVCGSPIDVFFGRHSLDWVALCLAADALATPALLPQLRRTPNGHLARENALRLLRIVQTRNLHRRYARFMPYQHNDPNMASLHHVATPWRITPLSALLPAFRDFSATDPRDKIYALLGLVADKDRPPNPLLYPDYRLLAPKLMNLTARHLLGERDAPRAYFEVSSFLGTGHARLAEGPSQAVGMASWAADWTCETLSLPLHEPRGPHFAKIKYAAADQVVATRAFGKEANGGRDIFSRWQADELWLRGERFDEIVALWPPGKEETWAVGEVIEVDPATGRTTFSKDRAEEILGCHDKALEMALRAQGGDKARITEELWRTLIGNKTETQRPAPDDTRRLYERWLAKMRDLLARDDIMDDECETAVVEDMTDMLAWNDLLRQCAVGRKLCITWMGWLAMVPMGSQVGDAIALLYGAATPMVLRWKEESKIGTGERRCELIGECYTHGVMDGEGMRGLKLSEIFRIW